MGDDLLVSYTGSETRQVRSIVNFVPHPDFSKDNYHHDIGVIRVSFT